MDRGSGVEGVVRALGRHPVGGEPASLVVDEWQQCLGGTRVALVDGVQDPRDIGHGVQ